MPLKTSEPFTKCLPINGSSLYKMPAGYRLLLQYLPVQAHYIFAENFINLPFGKSVLL